MALDKKYSNKINENNLDDWLHSTGFLYPKNEKQLERFEKLYEDYDFKLSNEDLLIPGKEIEITALKDRLSRVKKDLKKQIALAG